MSGEKSLLQNCFKQWELELYCMLTRLSDNLLKLEHQPTQAWKKSEQMNNENSRQQI